MFDLMDIVNTMNHIREAGKITSSAEAFALGFAEGVLYAEAQKEQQVTTVYTGQADGASSQV